MVCFYVYMYSTHTHPVVDLLLLANFIGLIKRCRCYRGKDDRRLSYFSHSSTQ